MLPAGVEASTHRAHDARKTARVPADANSRRSLSIPGSVSIPMGRPDYMRSGLRLPGPGLPKSSRCSHSGRIIHVAQPDAISWASRSRERNNARQSREESAGGSRIFEWPGDGKPDAFDLSRSARSAPNCDALQAANARPRSTSASRNLVSALPQARPERPAGVACAIPCTC